MQFRTLLFSLLLILITAKAYLQTSPFYLHFDHLGLEEGLSDNRYNNFIFQDSKGYTWISSISGLNRFDGENVKQYGRESGMIGNNIQSGFFEDHESNVWFSTYEAIACYVRATDSIQSFTFPDPEGNNVVGMRAFYLDSMAQRLWFSGGHRLYSLNLNCPEQYFQLPDSTDGYHFNVWKDPGSNLMKIFASKWQNGEGMEIFTVRDSLQIEFREVHQDLGSIMESYLLDDSTGLINSEGRLYFFTPSDPGALKQMELPFEGLVWDLVPIGGSNLLISTEGEGMYQLDWKRNLIISHWMTRTDSPTSLSSNHPRELYISPSNFVWTSSRNRGIDYAYLYGNSFSTPALESLFRGMEIVSVDEGPGGNIWVGTKMNGVYLLNGSGELVKRYGTQEMGLDGSILWQVSSIEDLGVFAATNDHFYYFDRSKDAFFPVKSNDSPGFRYISHFRDGRIAVSTENGLLELITDPYGRFSLSRFNEFTKDNGFNYLQIFESSGKKVYIPFQSSELWIYDTSPAGLTEFSKLKCETEFFGFFESRRIRNTIWAGSSKGLIRIVNDTSLILELEDFPSFVNTIVYGVLEDFYGTLWLSSNKGLWQYDPEEKTLFQYEVSDGLPNGLFSLHNSALLTTNSTIWLGTTKGLVKFTPSEVKPFSIRPDPFVEGLSINNAPNNFGIEPESKIAIKYSENTLSFLLSPVTYYKPRRSKILYRLKNYDDDWSTVSNGQEVRFTKIPPGEYSFEYKALDVIGNESGVKSLPVLVKTPFWRSAWFHLLLALAISTLVYRLYRFRMAQVRRDEEKKTAIAELQLQVVELENKALRAQMNPHFLSNALNSIKGVILKNDMKMAASHLTGFSSLIRTILSNSDKKQIVLSKELEALKLYIDLESLRFTQKFTYSIRVDKDVDQGFVRIPPLILQPFVENAIWHGLLPKQSGSKKLTINIFRKGDYVICEIEDNGIGRNSDKVDTWQKDHDSMGIGLTLKRIQLLHPDNNIAIIDLKDEKGIAQGTKVLVQLYAPT